MSQVSTSSHEPHWDNICEIGWNKKYNIRPMEFSHLRLNQSNGPVVKSNGPVNTPLPMLPGMVQLCRRLSVHLETLEPPKYPPHPVHHQGVRTA